MTTSPVVLEKPPPPKPAPPPPPAFGIDKAIVLMRALPLDDDPDLVLRVVRKTLRSTGVSVEEIIDSAKKREQELVSSNEADRASITRLEGEIAELRSRIDRVTKQLAETTDVRKRLQEAVQSESKIGPLVMPVGPAAPEPPAPLPLSAAPKPSAPPPPKKPTAPPLVKRPLPPTSAAPPPAPPARIDRETPVMIPLTVPDTARPSGAGPVAAADATDEDDEKSNP